MIKFKFGSTRFAVILFNWLVIKLPKFRLDIMELESWKIKEIPKTAYLSFVCGVTANMTEALTYEHCECRHQKKMWGVDTPLVPVFSTAFANFQIYQGENIPTDEEVVGFLQKMPPVVFEWYSKCDRHDVSNHNWRKTAKGLRIIDYGGQPLISDNLSYFLKFLVIHSTRIARHRS